MTLAVLETGRHRKLARIARIVLMALLLVSALAARQLALPTGAFACSCAGPEPGAPAFTGEEQAVFIGSAGQPQPDGTYRFSVQRWFVGGNALEVTVASEREPMPDGAVSINTCGLHFEMGDQLIMAAGLSNGVYQPGLCLPHAVLNSEEGDRLLAAAEATFGAGAPPGQVPPGEAPPGTSSAAFTFDLATVALVAVGLVVLLALIVVGYAMTRRGSAGDEA